MEQVKYDYSNDYTDEDKAIYDDLISRGMCLVGTKIRKEDIWLLHLSAKITINNMKGYSNEMTDEEIEKTKKLHREAKGNYETPAHLYEGGFIRTECGKIARHPLDKTAEEFYQEQMRKPDDFDENQGVDYITTKIDEMLEVN